MRYLIKFCYDGTNFSGYQRQPGKRTVQGCLEDALEQINDHQKTVITATGRTDRGVHALEQYAHVDINVEITPYKLKRALNSYLPEDVHVIETKMVNDDYHVRYDVVKKEYQYHLNMGEYNPMRRHYVYQHNYQLDIKSMQDAIKYFIGTHDFRAFVTENELKENCVRTIETATITFDSYHKDEIIFTFIGSGFMRYQIRNMVGLLLKVGNKKIKPIVVKEILDSKVRDKHGARAPSCGLHLVKIELKSIHFNEKDVNF